MKEQRFKQNYFGASGFILVHHKIFSFYSSYYGITILLNKKSIIMKNPKIQLSFAKLTDNDLLQKAIYIVTSITISPAFANPIPTLQEVQAAIDIYSAKLNAAEGLGRVNVADKNLARTNLEQLLYKLGLWVMVVADGVEAVLVSSGYTIAKEPQPRKLAKPGDVTLTYGNTAGTLISSIYKGNGSSFIHEITDVLPTDETKWTGYPASTSQFTFTNLVPGKQYWVRVAAVGNRKQIAYSNIATQFAAL